jgi:hypothetical protein
MAIGVLLASAVYCYATDLTSEHPLPLGQRFGNYFYAMALMAVPFYGGMWAMVTIEKREPVSIVRGGPPEGVSFLRIFPLRISKTVSFTVYFDSETAFVHSRGSLRSLFAGR